MPTEIFITIPTPVCHNIFSHAVYKTKAPIQTINFPLCSCQGYSQSASLLAPIKVALRTLQATNLEAHFAQMQVAHFLHQHFYTHRNNNNFYFQPHNVQLNVYRKIIIHSPLRNHPYFISNNISPHYFSQVCPVTF